MALLDFYGVSFAELLGHPDGSGTVVTRYEDLEPIAVADPGWRFAALSVDGNGDVIVGIGMLAAGGQIIEPLRYEGTKLFVIMHGEVTFQVDEDEPVNLSPGDSVHIPSQTAVSFQNLSDEEACLLSMRVRDSRIGRGSRKRGRAKASDLATTQVR
jgi:quercetin dioxygenase-like cupin family protein